MNLPSIRLTLLVGLTKPVSLLEIIYIYYGGTHIFSGVRVELHSMRSVSVCPKSKLTQFRSPKSTKSKPVTHFVRHVGSAGGLVLWGSPTLPPAGVPGVTRGPGVSRRVGGLEAPWGKVPRLARCPRDGSGVLLTHPGRLWGRTRRGVFGRECIGGRGAKQKRGLYRFVYIHMTPDCNAVF